MQAAHAEFKPYTGNRYGRRRPRAPAHPEEIPEHVHSQPPLVALDNCKYQPATTLRFRNRRPHSRGWTSAYAIYQEFKQRRYYTNCVSARFPKIREIWHLFPDGIQKVTARRAPSRAGLYRQRRDFGVLTSDCMGRNGGPKRPKRGRNGTPIISKTAETGHPSFHRRPKRDTHHFTGGRNGTPIISQAAETGHPSFHGRNGTPIISRKIRKLIGASIFNWSSSRIPFMSSLNH